MLVIGAGPGGAATACWLAQRGHHVVVVERKAFPRGKTCGGALLPGAVAELTALGLEAELDGLHRHRGVTVRDGDAASGRAVDVDWPEHPGLPRHGVVVRRRSFDEVVARHAVGAGAVLLEEHEAIEPLVERGFVRGALARRPDGSTVALGARYLVVADGGNSRFGRAIGTFRAPDWPTAVGVRTYYDTPRHDHDRLEVAVGLRDRDGAALPAYGWVFPLGDGTANVGVSLLSTARDARSINTSHLLDAWVHDAAGRWGFDPTRPIDRTATSRMPLGASVGPSAGPTFLVVGDAAGSADPFTAEGIGAAYVTGRLAAEVLHEALTTADATALQRYPQLLADRRGEHLAAGRLVARALGRPRVSQRAARWISTSPRRAEMALRVATGAVRPGGVAPTDLAARALVTAARIWPDP